MTARRLGLVLGILSVLALIFAATSWFVTPRRASETYGIPLVGQFLAYATVKGVQDLIPALLAAFFLWRRELRAAGLSLLVGTLIPISDAFLGWQAQGFNLTLFGLHGVYFIIMGLGGWLLVQSSSQTKVEANEKLHQRR